MGSKWFTLGKEEDDMVFHLSLNPSPEGKGFFLILVEHWYHLYDSQILAKWLIFLAFISLDQFVGW
jgi:hypothetical protein